MYVTRRCIIVKGKPLSIHCEAFELTIIVEDFASDILSTLEERNRGREKQDGAVEDHLIFGRLIEKLVDVIAE